MEQSKEKHASWLSVPQFGDWDQKGQLPDYSMDFTKIREMRKQNKNNVSRASLGNEEELTASSHNSISTGHSEQQQHNRYHQTNSPTILDTKGTRNSGCHTCIGCMGCNYTHFIGERAIKYGGRLFMCYGTRSIICCYEKPSYKET